ncbi:MAG: S-layer protein [Candidatus Peribacteria bacterium]|nr:S-layer protein [Candidatus Peribacteria bacterium]
MSKTSLSAAVYSGLIVTMTCGNAVAKSAYDSLQSDIPKLQTIVNQDAQDEALEQQDANAEMNGELFPVSAASGTVVVPKIDEKFVTVTENGTVTPLTDVPRQAWFAPYVRDVAMRGIVSGYRNADGKLKGEFGAANSVSLAELSKMAVKAAQIDEAKCTTTVKNTMAKTDWSRQYVGCAETLHWTVFDDAAVDIHRPATRGEVVATLLQAFDVPAPGPATGVLFNDVKADTLYAAAIEKAVQSGIVNGYTDAIGNRTGAFGPLNGINRAEVAKMLSLSIQKLTR